MLFEDSTFLWEPYRAVRSGGEVHTAFCSATEQIAEKGKLQPEYRFAARRLLYACVGGQDLLNVLDGLLLPPPYFLESLCDRQLSRREMEEAMDVIPPELDPVVALIPFNVAIHTGVYDARLRAAVRRLCWLFAIPFELIEEHESALMDAMLSSSSAPTVVGVEEELRQKQQLLQSRKEKKKRSLGRVAVVGAFTLVGGAALVVTGGLAAPLLSPALSALAGATVTTLGVVGSAGGAVLGTTAAAGMLTGLVGAATHAAALAVLVTPVLTTMNVAAIFGVGGASLAGYRAYRRTSDSAVFMIRSTEEIEKLPPLSHTDDALLSVLNGDQLAQWRDATRRAAVEEEKKDSDPWPSLQDVLEEATKGGIVVPVHIRAVTMQNVSLNEHFQCRMRCLTFAVQCSLSGYQLDLKALKLTAGTWGLVPPKVIPDGSAGVFACLNRFARPTGAGCVMCYHAVPVTTLTSATMRVWILAQLSLFGGLSVAVDITDPRETLQPRKMLKKLKESAAEFDRTITTNNILVHCRLFPLPFVEVSGLSGNGNYVHSESSRSVAFPLRELAQRTIETMKMVRERRKIAVSIVNNSRHLVSVIKCFLVNGVQSSQTPNVVAEIGSQQASLGVFTNTDMSLMGAEGFYLIEFINSSANDATPVLHKRFYIKLQFEVSALNKIRAECIASPLLHGLMEIPVKLEKTSSSDIKPISMPESFVSAELRLSATQFTVELRVCDFVERASDKCFQKYPSITVAVGGYVSTFDERRPQQDQQVALWAPFLPRTCLFGATEAYVVHWEDECQAKFGRTINVGSTAAFANRVGHAVISTAKSTVKRHIPQGYIFMGIRALGALKGTLMLPMCALWATSVIDNAFATLSNRARYAGKDLAHALLDPTKGNRPVSLIGFGFGSCVIVECLVELHHAEAFSIVENVFLMGSTVTSSRVLWEKLRHVVAGRLVNVYSRSDWMLWLMYKTNEASLKPMAGISPVKVPGVENLDVSFLVMSHADYAEKLEEIVEAIPVCPTRQMYECSAGITGALVKLDAVQSVSKRMMSSMTSLLDSVMCATVAISNRLVSDVKGVNTEFRCVESVVYDGYFDFEPPDSIPFARCAVFGVIGDNKNNESMNGAVSYVLSIDAPDEAIYLLLTVFFHMCGARKKKLSAEADMQVVRQTRTDVETKTNQQKMLREMGCMEAKDPESIRQKCDGAEQIHNGGQSCTQSFPVNLNNVFCDSNSNGEVILHITTQIPESSKCSFMVDVVALLTQSSTHTERLEFTADHFDKCHHSRGEPNAATPVPLDMMRRAIRNFNECFITNQNDEKHGVAPLQPIIIANCGESTLFFTTCADSDGGCGFPFTDAEKESETPLEWICVPSPKLPPLTCVVTAVRRSHCCFSLPSLATSSSPSLRVPPEQSDGTLLDSFALDCDGGRCTVQLLASAGGAVDVACHFDVNSAADGYGNVSVTHVDVDNVTFVLASITWTPEKEDIGNEEVTSSPNPGSWILVD